MIFRQVSCRWSIVFGVWVMASITTVSALEFNLNDFGITYYSPI